MQIFLPIPAQMADIPSQMADLDARRWADLVSQIPHSPIQNPPEYGDSGPSSSTQRDTLRSSSSPSSSSSSSHRQKFQDESAALSGSIRPSSSGSFRFPGFHLSSSGTEDQSPETLRKNDPESLPRRDPPSEAAPSTSASHARKRCHTGYLKG